MAFGDTDRARNRAAAVDDGLAKQGQPVVGKPIEQRRAFAFAKSFGIVAHPLDHVAPVAHRRADIVEQRGERACDLATRAAIGAFDFKIDE